MNGEEKSGRRQQKTAGGQNIRYKNIVGQKRSDGSLLNRINIGQEMGKKLPRQYKKDKKYRINFCSRKRSKNQ